jgi:NAD(P)-dependent dehydrogenase (short-subunit alcohol dehydrogenase family)
VRKVLVITGGSRGIGAAVARIGAKNGYSIALSYKGNAEAAVAVVKSIKEARGEAIAIQADISNREEVRKMFSTIDEQFGPPTALVNNAGVLEQQGRITEVSPERLQRIFSVNIFGAFYCSQEAVKRMSTKSGGEGGSIVNVSSVASRLGAGGEYVDYAASKGALDSFTIGLAQEVAAEGIRVNGVRPGFIYTDIHAAGGEPDRVNRVSASIPLKRGGKPEEVAAAIMWLLSDESAFTTGAFIEVAGGR